MDILDFSEEIKNFRHNGVTLNLDERMQLEMALCTLQAKIETEELVFWGKIEGIKNPMSKRPPRKERLSRGVWNFQSVVTNSSI